MKRFIFFAIFIRAMSFGLETLSQCIGIRGGFQSAGTWNSGEQVDNSFGAFYAGLLKTANLD
jgi:hypothetical protein